jgi:hypothetical protein
MRLANKVGDLLPCQTSESEIQTDPKEVNLSTPATPLLVQNGDRHVREHCNIPSAMSSYLR